MLDFFLKNRDFTISTLELEITNGKPHWYNYFLCGLLGIKEKFQLEAMVGMNVCVHGTIPKSSGLSSSSAMVVCAALSALIANNLSLTKVRKNISQFKKVFLIISYL